MKGFCRSAEQGNVEAENSLGDAFYRDKGVRHDFTDAVKWLRRAAGRGSAYAQHILGCAYTNGEAMPNVYIQAHMWFTLAAEHYPIWATENRNSALAHRGLIERT
jgi:TPR repeat protein